MLTDHEFDKNLIKKVLAPPSLDSHKGQNGKVLIIAGSSLFHGAGLLTAEAVNEVLVSFSSLINDMVYFCSTEENIKYLKSRIDNFIGIKREVVNDYIDQMDVILSGPGLMREIDEKNDETHSEPEFTKKITLEILKANKKLVLDAGSIQTISPDDLTRKGNIIITPHRREMAKLFNLNLEDLVIESDFTNEQIEEVGNLVFEKAKETEITILLKGPIDIIAGKEGWYFIKGGSPAMTKGGTGDVLAGITAALFTKLDNALLVAATASFLNKKAGEKLEEKYSWVFNSADLAKELTNTIREELVTEVK